MEFKIIEIDLKMIKLDVTQHQVRPDISDIQVDYMRDNGEEWPPLSYYN